MNGGRLNKKHLPIPVPGIAGTDAGAGGSTLEAMRVSRHSQKLLVQLPGAALSSADHVQISAFFFPLLLFLSLSVVYFNTYQLLSDMH